jgi:hypothetical protein
MMTFEKLPGPLQDQVRLLADSIGADPTRLVADAAMPDDVDECEKLLAERIAELQRIDLCPHPTYSENQVYCPEAEMWVFSAICHRCADVLTFRQKAPCPNVIRLFRGAVRAWQEPRTPRFVVESTPGMNERSEWPRNLH